MVAHPTKDERIVTAASGFTSLWALTWLGSAAMGAGGVVQGGFAVGSVMAGSGLAALWWKTRALQRYHDASEDPADAADSPQREEHLEQTRRTDES